MSNQAQRRMGGALDKGRKTIVIQYGGVEHTVSWFPGASDESISRTIENAFGIPPGTPLVVREHDDSTALAVSESIPDGLKLVAQRVESSMGLLGGNGKGNGAHGQGLASIGGNKDGAVYLRRVQAGDGFHGSGSDDGKLGNNGAEEFRGELLKFERVNAHLANERTWLAWVRTALAVLGVALSLLSLADDLGSLSGDSLALTLGVTFVLCTLFTYLTGYLRYFRVKQVLSWNERKMKEMAGRFKRFGLGYQAYFLGIALILTVPLYIAGGINIVVDG